MSAGDLRERPDGTFVLRRPEEFPAAAVSLRSASRDGVAIVDTGSGELLGTVDMPRAHTTVHDGAVYLHGGRVFEVDGLDLEGRRALVHPFDGDWYTQPKYETDTYIERLIERRSALGVTLSFGTVVVTEQVLAYQKKSLSDHEAIDLVGARPAADVVRHAGAVVRARRRDPRRRAAARALLGSLHAAEHSQIAVLPLLAMCDRWDIGGLSTNFHPQTGRPTIFIYDGHPGGIGIARRGFVAFEALVDDAHRLVSECPCESGCPSCVQSPKCGNLNEPLSKAGCAAADGADARRRASACFSASSARSARGARPSARAASSASRSRCAVERSPRGSRGATCQPARTSVSVRRRAAATVTVNVSCVPSPSGAAPTVSRPWMSVSNSISPRRLEAA